MKTNAPTVTLNHATEKFRVSANGKIVARVDEVEYGTTKQPIVCIDCRSVVSKETPVLRGFNYDSSSEVIKQIGHPARALVFEIPILSGGH